MSVDSAPRYFEYLCENVNFAIIATDEHGDIRFWNHSAEHMFGARPETMIGQPAAGIFPEIVRREAVQLIRTAIDQSTGGDLEFKLGSESAGVRLNTAVISPILAADGSCLGVSICMRDITRRREWSRQMAKVRRMASLGKLAGGVAHHFNNILGGLTIKIDSILSVMHPRDRLHKDLTTIADAVGRAARISGQLMTFAEGDHDPGYPQELRQVLKSFISDSSESLAELGIQFVTEIAELPSTIVESRRLRSVLDSMRQNAVEAMPNGGTLTLQLRAENSEAVVSLGDSGCGIKPEALEHIFEPFFTSKGELGGGAGRNTGLGLSIVHSFVEDMGGRLEVKSTVGVGTTFEIRLPLGTNQAERRRGEV